MKLTQNDFEKVVNVIKNCDICGKKRWEVSEDIAGLIKFEEIPTSDVKATPIIMATCLECGNMKLFNPIVLNQNK